VKAWRIIAALLACLIVAPPGAAQTEAPIGSYIRRPKPADVPEKNHRSKADVAREFTYQFGTCVVLTFPRRADEIAGFTLNPEQVYNSMRRMATSDCVRNADLTMPPMLMRGAIFRGLYLRDFAKEQPALGVQPIDYGPVSGPSSVMTTASFMAFMSFADCVVRADPAGTRSLTMSIPGSAAETAAIRQVSPKLGDCLVAGANVSFNRATLTALISEALYRQAKAAVQPTQATVIR
jgi:hypothetical protein